MLVSRLTKTYSSAFSEYALRVTIEILFCPKIFMMKLKSRVNIGWDLRGGDDGEFEDRVPEWIGAGEEDERSGYVGGEGMGEEWLCVLREELEIVTLLE
ncbi:hypothetical protein M5K25_013003 [Dendrobium thyrsiflorum]|uniref:Uncharacterized protein n=1 Tax=Dendrobium thyrsiflorum TaxID=117978 RepID=A0ABD0UY79_DENTH